MPYFFSGQYILFMKEIGHIHVQINMLTKLRHFEQSISKSFRNLIIYNAVAEWIRLSNSGPVMWGIGGSLHVSNAVIYYLYTIILSTMNNM